MSSEAKRALACRGPSDVINMAVLWGLGQERGVEAIGREARSAVVQAEMKRRSYGGVVDVVYGGEKHEKSNQVNKWTAGKQGKGKRKAELLESQAEEIGASPKPISKREQKRQAKKLKLDNTKEQEGEAKKVSKEPLAVEVVSRPQPLKNGDVG